MPEGFFYPYGNIYVRSLERFICSAEGRRQVWGRSGIRARVKSSCLSCIASLVFALTDYHAVPLPLVADQVVEEFHRIFEEGMDCFVAGDWGASKSYFEQALAIVPRDKPSQVGVP